MITTLASTSNATEQPTDEGDFPPQPTAVRYCKNCHSEMSWVIDRPNHRWCILCYPCRNRQRRKKLGGDPSTDYRRRLPIMCTYDLWDEEWTRCRERFLQTIGSRSKASLTYYTNILDNFFSEPAKRPQDYTYEDVWVFIHRPCKQGSRSARHPPSIGTINTKLTVLSSFYGFARRRPFKLISGDLPTDGITAGKPSRNYRVLSLAEIARFLGCITRDTPRGARDFAIFTTYFYTASRLSAVARLRYGDIEPTTFFENGVSRAGWTFRFFGKGHSTQEMRNELPTPAYHAIMEWLAISGRLPTIKPDDPIFIGVPPSGNLLDQHKPLGNSTIERACKVYAQKVGIDPQKICVHSFRHTSAREHAAAGADWRVIQRLLGHQSLQTTGLYLEVLVGQSDPTASLLEQRLQADMTK